MMDNQEITVLRYNYKYCRITHRTWNRIRNTDNSTARQNSEGRGGRKYKGRIKLLSEGPTVAALITQPTRNQNDEVNSSPTMSYSEDKVVLLHYTSQIQQHLTLDGLPNIQNQPNICLEQS